MKVDVGFRSPDSGVGTRFDIDGAGSKNRTEENSNDEGEDKSHCDDEIVKVDFSAMYLLKLYFRRKHRAINNEQSKLEIWFLPKS